MNRLRSHLRQSATTLFEVLRARDLRRLELSWAGSTTAEGAYLVALGIFAFRTGGTTAVGLVGLLRMLPAAAIAPVAAILGDRYRRRRLLVCVEVARATTLGGMAAASYSGAPAATVYALATLLGIASTLFRPAQVALLPWLARSPEELIAANAASATIEGAGTTVGPLLGGVLVATTAPGAVFAGSAAAYVLSALALAGIQSETETLRRPALGRRLGATAVAGFQELARRRAPRLVVALFGAQTLVRGALNVLIVVSALGLLHMGTSGVGFLTAAIGGGGMIGALAALGVLGRRLAVPLGAGLVLWGLPIAAVGAWPQAAPALALLALLGAGNSILDVSGLTLLQRITPDEALTRVLGVLEGVVLAAIALGSILVLPLVSALGTRGALLAVGSFLPLVTLLSWRRLLAIDKQAVPPQRELALLARVPMFSPLSVAATEQLARSLIPLEVASGEQIIREGESGDRFYVIADGELEVTRQGRHLATRGPGEHVGEIALLRGVPRTATVTARRSTLLYALDREHFLRAVTGHAGSLEVGDTVVESRLANIARVDAEHRKGAS